jgi:rhodanese-related sulfurtransferase
MEDLRQFVTLFKENKAELLDMRDFETYMKGHIPNSILAPFVEGRWGKEIGDYIGNRKAAIIVLFDNETNANKAKGELSDYGHTLAMFPYSEFKKAGDFEEAVAHNISSSDFNDNTEKFEVIDVREPYEWNTGHIENAHLISLNDLFQQYETLDKKKEYAIVCEHGNRSLYASIFLADKGFKVYNIEGGMAGLKKSGYF